MTTHTAEHRTFGKAFRRGALFIFCALALGARAQCPLTEVINGLEGPLGIVLSPGGNLIISETGEQMVNTGRISIVDPTGNRRTLLSGLPSGFSADGGEYSGPTGMFLRDRTLYLAIGVGDAVLAGSTAGTTIANPSPSSPLFSSVLAIHFSAAVESSTTGYTLSATDQQTLANNQPVTLSNGSGDSITIELVVNFPDYTPDPQPGAADNVRNANPFGVVGVGNKLYVTDGGQNVLEQVDLNAHSFSTLVNFPPIANTLPFGPPMIDAVPTGIVYSDGKLLVTLFRGFPFPPGSSVVEQIDPTTGSYAPLISGLKTAIGVLPIRSNSDADSVGPNYLVLEHSSGNVLDGPGMLSRFATPDGSPTVIADCLTKPTSMTLDSRTGLLYLAEITGRITSTPVNATAFEAFDFDLNRALAPTALNISTRGQVGTGDNVLIAGFILAAGGGGGEVPVVVRAIGPSLTGAGVAGALSDPLLELHDANGALIVSNDNWKDTQQTEIEATGLAPTNDKESAILRMLAPGNYTAIVRGVNDVTGVALAEFYILN